MPVSQDHGRLAADPVLPQGALGSEEVPSWLIIKKKMGVRSLLSEVEHRLKRH